MYSYLSKKSSMSQTRSRTTGHVRQRLHRDRAVAAQVRHVGLAGEAVAAVDVHGAGAADGRAAAVAEGQRAVLLLLDVEESLEDGHAALRPARRSPGSAAGAAPGSKRLMRKVTSAISTSSPAARTGPSRRACSRACGGPSRLVAGERVPQPVVVVARLEVGARVRAARLLARERPAGGRQGHVEHALELHRAHHVEVPDAAGVPQLGLLAGAPCRRHELVEALLHRAPRRGRCRSGSASCRSSRCGWRRRPRCRAAARPRRCGSCRRAAAAPAAAAAAALPPPLPALQDARRRRCPARRPKTIVSSSELPPRRLAPCTLTQAHSPAAQQAGHHASCRPRRCRCRPWSSAGRAGWGWARRRGRRPRSGSARSRMPGSRSAIFSAPRWRRSRYTKSLPPMPRPASISCWMEREVMSRGASSIGRRRVAQHEALAVVVEQVAALAAAALGHEDVRGVEARGVELDELHVLERHAGVVGHAPRRRRC